MSEGCAGAATSSRMAALSNWLALAMSPAICSSKVGQMLCCPITTKSKGYPLDVEFKAEKVAGVVLSDQIKSLDWKARNEALAGPVSNEVPA